eukprot:Amastigsp_a691_137.p3 type:complete len:149 gc:universal Amastigsp_a691_137:534-980(+)
MRLDGARELLERKPAVGVDVALGEERVHKAPNLVLRVERVHTRGQRDLLHGRDHRKKTLAHVLLRDVAVLVDVVEREREQHPLAQRPTSADRQRREELAEIDRAVRIVVKDIEEPLEKSVARTERSDLQLGERGKKVRAGDTASLART